MRKNPMKRRGSEAFAPGEDVSSVPVGVGGGVEFAVKTSEASGGE